MPLDRFGRKINLGNIIAHSETGGFLGIGVVVELSVSTTKGYGVFLHKIGNSKKAKIEYLSNTVIIEDPIIHDKKIIEALLKIYRDYNLEPNFIEGGNI